MSDPLRIPSDGDGTAPARWSAGGLRARLAVAITLPALVGGLVASFIPWPEWQWPGFAIAALVTALGAWLWLDATVARRLRRVARALEPGGDAHAISPGGGLSALVETAVAARIRERELERGVERLEIVRAALTGISLGASEWAETERAPAFDVGGAPEELAPLVMRLSLAAQRLDERSESARAVAAQVRETVSDAGGRATTLAAAAERQFVEAGSLLAVLRALERSSGELSLGVAGLATLLAAGAADSEAGRAASEALAHAAREQNAELTRADERLRAAHKVVARVLEAARLAAVESAHAALAAGDLPGEDRARLTDALAGLVRSARAAEDQARALDVLSPGMAARASAEIERAIGMRAIGEEAKGGVSAVRASDPVQASRRALERLLEAVQEAISRAERLVQQAERTSSEAQRAGEGVATAVDEVDGLVARFTEAAPAAGDAAMDAPAEAGPAVADPRLPDGDEAAQGPQRPLRVLGPEDFLPDDETWSHG